MKNLNFLNTFSLRVSVIHRICKQTFQYSTPQSCKIDSAGQCIHFMVNALLIEAIFKSFFYQHSNIASRSTFGLFGLDTETDVSISV